MGSFQGIVFFGGFIHGNRSVSQAQNFWLTPILRGNEFCYGI